MDVDSDEESTQLATQPLPTHHGIPPSHSHGPDLSDALCVLHPASPVAIQIVQYLAKKGSPLIVKLPEPRGGSQATGSDFAIDTGNGGVQLADGLESEFADGPDRRDALPAKEDIEGDDEPTQQTENDKNGKTPMTHDIILRNTKPGPKDESLGFLFGRNPNKCDVVLVEFNTFRRVSNVHFRIYSNKNGVLMIEDMSTNGTWVDTQKLGRNEPLGPRRVLTAGSMIDLVPGDDAALIRFIVRVPREALAAKIGNANSYWQVGIDPGPPPNHPLPRIHDAPMINIRPPRPNIAQRERVPKVFQDNHHAEAHSTLQRQTSEGWGGGGIYKMETAPIGKGAFATVTKAVQVMTGDTFAVKSIAKRTFATNTGTERLGVKKEVDILEKLDHPHIVQYLECHEDAKFIYIVMEYIKFGDLNTYVQKNGFMQESLAKEVIRQVLKGIEYVHKMGISHRDLKPDNILISCEDPIHVKISDFGLAKMVHNEETFLKTFCGTMLYLAPEVFPGYIQATQSDIPTAGPVKRKRLPGDDAGRTGKRKKTTPYNQAVDMWSLGCVVYVLLSGKPPFNGANQEEMFQLVVKGVYDEGPLMEKVGHDNEVCLDFIRSLLKVDPSMRLMEIEALRHPWLRDVSETSDSMSSQEPEDDRVQGVSHGLDVDESDYDLIDDEDLVEEEEAHLSDECPVKTSKPEEKQELELRDNMASMNMNRGQQNYDASHGSSDDYFASLSPHNGYDDGIGAIQQRLEVHKADLQQSSEIFPAYNPFPGMVNSVGESNDFDNDYDKPSQSYELDPFEFDHHEKFVTRQEDPSYTSKSGATRSLNGPLANLNFATANPTPHTTPPPLDQTPPRESISSGNAVFNLSPESLNASPVIGGAQVQPRPALPQLRPLQPIINTELPESQDDRDLPATMPVHSQPKSMSEPPAPWGRLTSLPGSLPHGEITLLHQQITIGRSYGSSVVEKDGRISKVHFAVQINYPKRDHQSIAAESTTSNWQLAPGMVAFYKVEGLNGVIINDVKKKKGTAGRLYDGDEIVLFRDQTDNKNEFMGFKFALWAGRDKIFESEETDDDDDETPRNNVSGPRDTIHSTAGLANTIAVNSVQIQVAASGKKL